MGVWGVVFVVCVCQCRECCSLSVCVCVGPVDLFTRGLRFGFSPEPFSIFGARPAGRPSRNSPSNLGRFPVVPDGFEPFTRRAAAPTTTDTGNSPTARQPRSNGRSSPQKGEAVGPRSALRHVDAGPFTKRADARIEYSLFGFSPEPFLFLIPNQRAVLPERLTRGTFDHWTTMSADCGPVVVGPSWLSTD